MVTWNYFPCVVLHKVLVKVFIYYVQILVHLLIIIVDFYIDNFIFALCIFMKDSNAIISVVTKFLDLFI